MKAYQYSLSPLIGYECRHLPTCSDYADDALARFGHDPVMICRSGEERRRLAPLPLAALRLDEATLAATRRLGIETVLLTELGDDAQRLGDEAGAQPEGRRHSRVASGAAGDAEQHLAFGVGVHFCLGAPLARMELQISLPTLLRHCPRLELTGEPVRRPTFVLRGYESVPVRSIT